MRRRSVGRVISGILIAIFLAWVVLAYAPGGVQEVRRGMVAARFLPWPSLAVSGTVVDAQAWDSELQSIALMIRDDSGTQRLVIINDATAGGVASSMPDLLGTRVSATVRGVVPWPAPEYIAVEVQSES